MSALIGHRALDLITLLSYLVAWFASFQSKSLCYKVYIYSADSFATIPPLTAIFIPKPKLFSNLTLVLPNGTKKVLLNKTIIQVNVTVSSDVTLYGFVARYPFIVLNPLTPNETYVRNRLDKLFGTNCTVHHLPMVFNKRIIRITFFTCPVTNKTKFSRNLIELTRKDLEVDDCRNPIMSIWYSNGTLYRLTYQIDCKGALESQYYIHAITFRLLCKR